MSTAQEIYAITYWDMIMDNGRTRRLIPENVRKARSQLIKIADQHERWHDHVRTLKDNTYFNPPKGAIIKGWKQYITDYRSKWWRETFGCEFNPICRNDCFLNGHPCSCGAFNGVVLDGERTIIE
jgi:hypothetical protein